MDDPAPPPYTSSSRNQPTSNIPASMTSPDRDLAAICHPHLLLITVVTKSEAGDDSSSSTDTILHYWPPRTRTTQPLTSTSSSLSISMQIDISSLRHVQNFQKLGTFTVPTTSPDLHQYLTSLLTTAVSSSNSEKIIADLITQLSLLPQPQAGQTLPPGPGLSVDFFSIEVLSSSPEYLLPDGLVPVWKWAKPTSSYDRKMGLWEVELEKALVDGEWNAGRELLVLVKEVEREMAEEMRLGKLRVGFIA